MRHWTTVVALVLAVGIVSGCAAARVRFVDEGRTFTEESAFALLREADPGTLAEESAADAAKLRHDALVSLRGRGASATKAADLLTSLFPSDTRAVPFHVEVGTFTGRPAIVIIEAMGRPGGALTDRRLWVLSEDGSVLLSGNR